MSIVMDMENLHAKTGYEPLDILFVQCRAKLPADLWRALSIAERPPENGQDIAVVDVTDSGVRLAVLPQRHYNTLVTRLQELERWIAEFVREGETA